MDTAKAGGIARGNTTPGRYPVNLRFTIPFLPRPIFVTIIIGQEKRARERLREERERHPINTWGNLVTVVTTWAVFLTAALFVAFVIATL